MYRLASSKSFSLDVMETSSPVSAGPIF